MSEGVEYRVVWTDPHWLPSQKESCSLRSFREAQDHAAYVAKGLRVSNVRVQSRQWADLPIGKT